ncbi:hypothetical protein JCM19239_6338 [Vibrio variabilis]|uniref:Uncharacterized protein n=1 Tax=Vibrio variabilis TaxID=990271 RepID=A0ABQ0J9H3_9VIBR|nr:hypothetical protein JCM19239_6338 [Vibrio variabilis]
MKVKLFIGAMSLVFAMGTANATSDTFDSTIITPPTLNSNAGEHNDRRNCQLAKRRGQELPNYCSIYM